MPATPIAWVIEELVRQFAAVVSTMTGAEASAGPDTSPGSAEPSGATDAITWVQPFDLSESNDPASGAIVVLTAPRQTWRLIGAKPLEAAGIPPEEVDDESARSTFLEILNQTMGALGSQAGARVNRQVLPRDGKEMPEWTDGGASTGGANTGGASTGGAYTTAAQQITLAATFPLPFAVSASQGWSAALAEPVQAETAVAAAAGAGSSDNASAILAQHSRTFDLLLEVELPVSISFGRAMVPLREVAKLTSGSVVELNRTVSDPVEIIVNNCVIARGEVVVIEGNYGIRIQQIISPQERLRTLH